MRQEKWKRGWKVWGTDMKPGMMIRLAVDLAMTVLLLLLMTYELIGQAVHEWLGIGMFVLLVLHHVLNAAWSRHIAKGSYTAVRIFQTVLVAGVLLTMAGSMVSGAILSRYALAFLPIRGGRSFARNLHMVCAYGGFVFMSMHLGFHWVMIMGIAGRHGKKQPAAVKVFLRFASAALAGYGVYAFLKRDIGSYLFLRNQFAFFDFEEPLLFFLVDYLAVMGLFICLGHYVSLLLRKIHNNRKR